MRRCRKDRKISEYTATSLTLGRHPLALLHSKLLAMLLLIGGRRTMIAEPHKSVFA
ncbi:hypothetical protein [Paraburkholderia aspalathi]|uniref:hypothetical protein n=1 Tax=Paraburkholderia aspalathi TaxID=1324617 RepID=UPI00142D3DFB|nr:hypothetical protein [Paraburkholderia aspalathi]